MNQMQSRKRKPSECSLCGAKDTLYIEADTIKCNLCGHEEPLNPAPKSAPLPPPPKSKWQASYGLTFKGEIDPWARAAFDTGQECIRREDWAGALDAFRRSIDAQADFLDAHLWIARLEEDPAIKRDHLTTLLAYDPNHLEAIRELMVLDGRMTQAEADRTHHYRETQVRHTDLPVGIETTTLHCPVCGGNLTENDELNRIECAYCGYVDTQTRQRGTSDSLTMALLERKANPIRWVIGERLLQCHNCGAARTIAGDILSTRCPFCGSNHVIEQDTLRSFQQPEGLIHFEVSKQEAAEAIKKKLESWTERVMGWFDNNKVARGRLEGVYLPFWAFDVILDVTKTTLDQRRGQGRAGSAQPYTREEIPEMMNNVLICAAKSPHPYLTEQISQYNLNRIVGYEPELLAKYPAELYDIDFDEASLEAHSRISKRMSAKYGQLSSSDIQIHVTSFARQMSFQLLLLPVWVATLIEQDGDIRLALVNGQTAKVVLGKARRPEG